MSLVIGSMLSLRYLPGLSQLTYDLWLQDDLEWSDTPNSESILTQGFGQGKWLP